MKDYSSIVVSSRVRLFRNLLGFKFPSMIDETEGKKVLNKVAETSLKLFPDYKMYRLKTLPELDVNVMREKKLVTSKLIDAVAFSSVILSEDESVSIMINESDHILEQCILPGFNLFKAYDVLSVIDDQIVSKLDIAFDDTVGFLTSNIGNIGTGMKASITMFLPALSINGSIKDIINKIQLQGFEVNSLEETDETQAYYYTFSNSYSIGKKETKLVVELTELAIQISDREIEERKNMLSYNKIDLITDKVFRAWGILTNCYKIGVEEAVQLLGEIKIGIALDIIKVKDINIIESLIMDIMPYSLTKISNSKISMIDLDKYRAKVIANVLKINRIK